MPGTIQMGAVNTGTEKPIAVLLEDSSEAITLFKTLLSAHGYDVVMPGASPSVELIQSLHPRLIVLSADIKNGFNICLKLKKDPVIRRVPLILTTAKSSPEVIRKHRLLPTRADAYLRKPATEAAILETLSELLPDDFKTPPPSGETNERTLVASGVLESAVVNYVEEEVGVLKEIVQRLQAEKTELKEKLVLLEQELKTEQYRLDSGLKQLAERAREAMSPEALEAIREEARRQGIEIGRREGREEGLREAQSAFTNEIENLKAKIAEYEAALTEERAKQEAKRREIEELSGLFERLEAGYKSEIETLRTEKAAFEDAAARAEAEAEELKASSAAVIELQKELEQLRLQAARTEILENENRLAHAEVERLKAQLETLKQEIASLTEERDSLAEIAGRVAELESALEGARKEADALRVEAEEAHKEARRLRNVVERMRSLLGSSS